MKTVAEINEKIRSGKVVVVDADEMVEIVREKGAEKAARQVDVVTTGTFAPMCSSGAFFNIGHPKPKMKMTQAWMNDVPLYCGIAAIDMYLGATELPEGDPANNVFPGKFAYGGGHVIEELVAGKKVMLRARAYGTNCYPRKSLHAEISLRDMNEAILCNPRNAYQNYNVAVNRDTHRTVYSYMGILRPGMANANYCSAGQLSPLLKDPTYRTVGVGTRIFLGGGIGYVWSHGTQHNPGVKRGSEGQPLSPAGTIAVSGDLKAMNPKWLRGVSLAGYGTSLAVGIGLPIPILDEELARTAGLPDEELSAPVVDYSGDYPNSAGEPLSTVNYAELKSGTIRLDGRDVPTASASSIVYAREIAAMLKSWIASGRFLLTQPVAPLPGPDSGYSFKPFSGDMVG